MSLEQLAKDYADYTRFICYEAEDEQSFKEMLQSADSKKYLILIGPEGGFAPEEVQLCKEAGFKVYLWENVFYELKQHQLQHLLSSCMKKAI